MASVTTPQNIVVIGGGIIGCTTAYYLTRHPHFNPSIHSITLIEASKLANGASGKAGGLVAGWAYPTDLARLSFELHDQLAQDHNGTEVWGYRRVRCGQLTAAAPQQQEQHSSELKNHSAIDLGKLWARNARDSSILPEDLDWFDAKSTQAYEEFADTSSTAQVHPFLFTNTMARLAEQSGARIVLGDVKHINTSAADDTIVDVSPLSASDNLIERKVVSVTYLDKATSTETTLPATTVVLAAGPWTSTLFPRVQMQPLRAHSVSIKLKRPVSAYCLFSDIRLFEARPSRKPAKSISLEIYARPNNEVYICSQGDLEIPLPPPDNAVEVSAESCQNMINAAISVSEELRNGQVTGRRACYLPTLNLGASSNPLIGYTELGGLALATGHSCWGISNAPGTGKAISELIFDGHINCLDSATLESMDPRRSL